jgi:two-component system, LytTR family, response regulator
MNVLIVEDEKVILDEIADYVCEFDASFQIRTHCDPLEALAMSYDDVDVALLDIHMPGISGLDLAKRLQDTQKDIKIIFITAYNHYGPEAFELEASDYLLKPVRKERLFRSLQRIAVPADRRTVPESTHPNNYRTRIQAFGSLSVLCANEPLRWKRSKSGELFAYLLTHLDQPINKYQLCNDLWPDMDSDKALVHLQTVTYQLRKSLTPISREEIKIEFINNHYRMIIGPTYYDVLHFDKAFELGMAPGIPKETAVKHLQEAIRIYRGSFLSYEGWLWAIPRQMALEKKYCRALVFLIDALLAEPLSSGGSGQPEQDAAQLEEYLDSLGACLGTEELKLSQYRALRDSLQK